MARSVRFLYQCKMCLPVHDTEVTITCRVVCKTDRSRTPIGSFYLMDTEFVSSDEWR